MPYVRTKSSELVMYKNLCTSAIGITAIRESEKIELCLTHGFAGMDLDAVEYYDRIKASDKNHAKRLISSADVALGFFELPVDLTAEDKVFDKQLADLANQAAAVSEVGCTRSQVIVEPANESLAFKENFERHRIRLGQVGDVLAKASVQLAVGFKAAANLRQDKKHEFVKDFAALQVLVDTVGKTNVGFAVDAWDIVCCGAQFSTLKNLRPMQIVTVTVADGPTDITPDKWDDIDRFLPGSTNAVNSVELLTWLADFGYRGPVTPAPSRKQFSGMTRDRIVKSTGDALDSCWRAANLSPYGKKLTAAEA